MTKQGLEDLVVEMYRKGTIKFGEFTLSSGRKSPYYIDLRILPSYPQLFRRIMKALVDLINQDNVEFDVVAGIETSGIIYASYLGCLLGKAIAYVRKKAKEYGTMRMVEGIVENKKVLLIDDVSTTGSTLYRAVESLREAGAIVEYAYVLIDRGEGAVEKLVAINVVLRPLMRFSEVLEILWRKGLISSKVYSEIKEYMEKWGKT
ncbi:MAG: orotate phosphoribosyltransferase [Thermoprotei archaeon]